MHTARNILHHIMYSHFYGEKEEIGRFTTCVSRLTGRSKGVWFRPSYDGAGWHQVDDIDVLKKMIRSGTREEAMAILRSNVEPA